MKAKIMIGLVMFVLMFSVVAAAVAPTYERFPSPVKTVCSVETDCEIGYVCEDGYCEQHCIQGLTECSDGLNNDDDVFIDYPNDPECRSPLDNDESSDPQCANKDDDDGDDLVDYPEDPSCLSPEQTLEGFADIDFEVAPMFAPEEEPGFFAKLWDWITFWN